MTESCASAIGGRLSGGGAHRTHRAPFNRVRYRSGAGANLRPNSAGCNRPWSNLCIERDGACCPPSGAPSARSSHRANPRCCSLYTDLGSVGLDRRDTRSVTDSFWRAAERLPNPSRWPPGRRVGARRQTRRRELRRCLEAAVCLDSARRAQPSDAGSVRPVRCLPWVRSRLG